MWKLFIGGIVAMIVLALAACGNEAPDAAADQARMQSDYWQIDQIEKDFHGAMTTKDIDRMMSLFAPNATMTVGPGATATGLDEIRAFWLTKAAPFAAENHWVSDHPAYKLEITVNGDRGTLHFECHYIDVDTEKVASATTADFDVARIDGKWLITNMVGGTTILEA
jgi:ketosteroid isomerase-like protein